MTGWWLRVSSSELMTPMKGKEHRDQFPAGEAPDIPSFPKGAQREELLCRLLGDKHRQYLFAIVRENVGQLQALATVRDYQIVLKRRVLF